MPPRSRLNGLVALRRLSATLQESPATHTSPAGQLGFFPRLHVALFDCESLCIKSLPADYPPVLRLTPTRCAFCFPKLSLLELAHKPGMNSTLMVSSNAFEVRAFGGEKSTASNQLGGQWGRTYSLESGLMKEQQSLPPSTGMFGGDDFSLRCIDGSMASFDAGRFDTCMDGRGNGMNSMPVSDPFYAQTTATSLSNPSPVSIDGSLQGEMAIDTGPSSESPSPKTKSTTVKKRGRPRKTQPAASAATISRVDAKTNTKSRRRTSTRSEPDASGSECQKALRVREKNRIAADKCRSRRRQEEDKLKSKHEDLEQEHCRLSGALSELMAETYVLKNMLMEHGSCDCRLIQDYLKESASEWVAKKLKSSTSPVGASPS